MRNLTQPDVVRISWMELLPAAQARTLQALHLAVMQAESTLLPAVKWGNIVYVHQRRALLALTPQRRSVLLQVFAGQALAVQFPLLADGGNGALQRVLWHRQPLPTDWVAALVRRAAEQR